MVNTVIQRHCNLPLSRLMAIFNSRKLALTPQARLSSHLSFRTNHKDAQAGLYGKIRRQTVTFLLCVLMGVSDQQPDDNVVQCALHLYFINIIL